MKESQNSKASTVDVAFEAGRFFDDSSVTNGDEPCIVILMGGVACGKTTLRKQNYSAGYILVDAAEIFINLSRGKIFPFPKAFEEPLNIIGELVARRAISERRHIVTEILGVDEEPLNALAEAMRSIGYAVKGQVITCDVEEALKRNENRGDNCISAYYAEPFQCRWLIDAAHGNIKR
jgi:hypothetical protein